MPRYGFRLYKVNRVRGVQGKPAPFTIEGRSGHYVDELADLVDDLAHQGNLSGTPALVDAADGSSPASMWDRQDLLGQAGTPRLRVESSSVSGRRLSVTVEFGKIGPYPRALGMNKAEDVTIEAKAPGGSHRVELLLPNDGLVGVMAVESVNSSAPGPALIQWLGAAGKQRAARPRATGPDWWRLRATQIKDWHRFHEMVTAGTATEIVLTRRGTSPSSRPYVSNLRVRAAVNVRPDESRLGAWIARVLEGAPSDRAAILDELSHLAGEDVGSIQFTDGWIAVETSAGTTRIGPSRIDDVFIYPTGDTRPNIEHWITEVRAAILEVVPQVGAAELRW